MNEFNLRLINKSCATCKARFPKQASNHILVSCPRDENMTEECAWISLKYVICDLYEPVELIFAEK